MIVLESKYLTIYYISSKLFKTRYFISALLHPTCLLNLIVSNCVRMIKRIALKPSLLWNYYIETDKIYQKWFCTMYSNNKYMEN